MRLVLFFAFLFATFFGWVPWAEAHDFSPGVLALVEREVGIFDVAWTEPVDSGNGEVRVSYPANCELRRQLVCRDGLRGAIAFEGLAANSRVKVVTSVTYRDGSHFDAIVDGTAPRLELAHSKRASWISIGAEHVLTGFDHIAFVIGLFLVAGSRFKRLLATITAFTIAHSLTLALATLHILELPRAPVEATIAASVILVARESLSSKPSLARTKPWLVSFLFGLVHGLGFAGALEELPLAPASFGVALLSFNLGIELAQLVIVGSLVGLSKFVTSEKPRRALSYAVGIAGVCWFFERLS